MALDAAGVSDVSLDEVLANDVQEFLADAGVLGPTLWDLTSRARKGQSSVKIPRITGLAASDVKQDNSEAVSSGMGLVTDNLPFDKFREVADYIFEGGDLESEVDLKEAFLEAAPKVYGEDIEAAVYAELKQASAAAPDHIIQMSENDGVGTNNRPSLGDIQLGAQLLDEAKVPGTERYLAVNPAIKTHLLAKSEIQDASKAGTNSALVNNEFARLFGFIMVSTNQVSADECVAYHRTAMAWAMQKTMEFIEEPQRSKGRTFVAIRGKYGMKILDSGKRVVHYNSTGA